MARDARWVGGTYALYSTEANTLFAAMTIAPSVTRKRVIDNLIVDLKANSVWAELDGLAVFAAHHRQAALLNWKNPGTFNFTETNNPGHAVDQGYYSNAINAYLANTYNLSSSGGQYAQNAASIFAWSNASGQDSKAMMGLASGTGSPGMRLYSRYTDDNHYYTVNSASEDSYADTDGKGFYSVSRRGGTSVEAYKNGVSKATSARASIALPIDTISLLAEGVSYHSVVVMCAGWGDQMTTAMHLALYNALHTYMQAVAGIA